MKTPGQKALDELTKITEDLGLYDLHHCKGKTHDWICPNRNTCQRHFVKSHIEIAITPQMKEGCIYYFGIIPEPTEPPTEAA